MNDFTEQRIIEAIKNLLIGRVNGILGDMQFVIPAIEFGGYSGDTVIVPVIGLASCECSEKERVIRQEAYALTITFSLTETVESELLCYAYAAAVCKAVTEDTTLGGVADRVIVTGKKYIPPKKRYCGENWEAVITMRVTTDQITVRNLPMSNEE